MAWYDRLLGRRAEEKLNPAQNFIALEEGLTVRTGSRKRKFEREEIIKWEGKRAQAGRLPPTGFPRTNKL